MMKSFPLLVIITGLKEKSVIEPLGSIWDSVQQKAKDQKNNVLNGLSKAAKLVICMAVPLMAPKVKQERKDLV